MGPRVPQASPAALDAPPGPQPAATTSSLPRGGGLPRPGWPPKNDLEYAKTAIELALLLLAIPYIIRHLATSPGTTVKRAGRKQLPGK